MQDVECSIPVIWLVDLSKIISIRLAYWLYADFLVNFIYCDCELGLEKKKYIILSISFGFQWEISGLAISQDQSSPVACSLTSGSLLSLTKRTSAGTPSQFLTEILFSLFCGPKHRFLNAPHALTWTLGFSCASKRTKGGMPSENVTSITCWSWFKIISITFTAGTVQGQPQSNSPGKKINTDS